MRKRILSLAIAICMVLALVPMTLSASAEDTYYQASYLFGTEAGLEANAPMTAATYAVTKGMWRYHSASNASWASGTQTKGGRIHINTQGKNSWEAVEINVPETDTYDISYRYFKFASLGGIGDVYIIPGNDEITSLDTAIAKGTKIAADVDYTGASNGAASDPIEFSGLNLQKGANTLLFVATTRKNDYMMFPISLTITSSSAPSGATFEDTYMGELTLDKTVFDAEDLSENTAHASVIAFKASDKSSITSGITFKSSNENVATVASDGTVTVVGGGEATIYAECSSPSKGSIIGTELIVYEKYYQASYLFGTEAGIEGNASLSSVTYADTKGLWKYHSASNASWAASCQAKSGRFNVNTQGKNSWMAVEINVPETGTYDLLYKYYKIASLGGLGDVYIIPGNDEITSLDTAIAKGTKIAADINYTESTGAGTPVEYKNLALSKGANTLLFVATTRVSDYMMFPTSLTITTASAPSGATFEDTYMGELTLDKTSFDAEDLSENTAHASVIAFKSSDKSSITSGITFKSSNENVATVASDGTVTVVGGGEATIYAECSSPAKGSIVGAKIAVAAPSYRFVYGFDTITGGFEVNYVLDNNTYANSFGRTKFIKSYHMSDIQAKDNRANMVNTGTDGLGQYAAFNINVPVSGTYNVEYKYFKIKNTGGLGDVYILPADTSLSDIGAALAKGVKIAADVDYSDPSGSGISPTNKTYSNLQLSKGEHMLVFICTGTGSVATSYPYAMYPNSVIITSSHAISASEFLAAYSGMVSVSKTELDIEETATATASVFDMSAAIKSSQITSGITYTSSNEAVATVASDGTVTAVGAGTAIISATCSSPEVGNVVGTEITVKKPGIGDVISDTDISVYVAAEEGGTATTDLPEAVSEVKIGTTVNVSAEANEGYEFAYWRDGSGKVLSVNAEDSFKINVNTAIVAVFAKNASSEDTTVPLWFYNGNGDMISKKDVTKGTTFGAEKIASPSLAGFVFDKWSVEDSKVISALTRAVAIFKASANGYTVKVNGAAVATDKKYDEQVTVSATEDNFTCWKVGENVVSYEKDFTFFVWGDVDFTKVCEGAAEAEPVVSLIEYSGNKYVVYSTPSGCEFVEAGILFAESGKPEIGSFYSKATAIKNSGEFTAQPNGSENVARGYLIYKVGTEYRVIYAD